MSAKDALDSGAGRRTGRRSERKEGGRKYAHELWARSVGRLGGGGSRILRRGTAPCRHGPRAWRDVPRLCTNPRILCALGLRATGLARGGRGQAQGPESMWIFQKGPGGAAGAGAGTLHPLAQRTEKQRPAPRSRRPRPTREPADQGRSGRAETGPRHAGPTTWLLTGLTALSLAVISAPPNPVRWFRGHRLTGRTGRDVGGRRPPHR